MRPQRAFDVGLAKAGVVLYESESEVNNEVIASASGETESQALSGRFVLDTSTVLDDHGLYVAPLERTKFPKILKEL